MLNDEGEIVKTKGESIDVPANRWIDIRLAMPESSVWNQHRKQENDAEIQELAAGDSRFILEFSYHLSDYLLHVGSNKKVGTGYRGKTFSLLQLITTLLASGCVNLLYFRVPGVNF